MSIIIVIAIILMVLALYLVVRAFVYINATYHASIPLTDYYVYRAFMLLSLSVFLLALAGYILK